jgi:hypothetical protein
LFVKDDNMRLSSINLTRNWAYSFSVIKCKSLAKSNWYSSSHADPIEIFRKWANSAFDFRPLPSAILVGIDAADLRTWLVNPYFSLSGKLVVISYKESTNRCDFLHTINFLKSCILSFHQFFKLNVFISLLYQIKKYLTPDNILSKNKLTTVNCEL